MRQIIVIGDNSSSNLGDPILTQSAYYTVCKAVEGMDYVVSIFDIAGRKKQKSMTPIFPPLPLRTNTHRFLLLPKHLHSVCFQFASKLMLNV